MAENGVWEVDRLAAAELLASIKAACAEDWPSIVMQALSRHRSESQRWAAKRVQESAIQSLEEEASREFERRDAIWTDGYRFAEQVLNACSPDELLGTATRPPPSKGQVLRNLVRLARKKHADQISKPR